MTTIITRAGKGSPLTNTEMDTNLTNLNTDKLETVNPSSSGTLTHSGDMLLSGSGKRITADFSNATIANRVVFQTSVVNGVTEICAVPSGVAQQASIVMLGNSSGANCSILRGLVFDGSETSLRSTRDGVGSYVPMTFYTGGSERMRIDTSGNVSVGSTNAGAGTSFNLSNPSTVAGSQAEVRVTQGAVAAVLNTYNNANANVGSISNHPVAFITNNTERLRIGTSGQLGIGGANYGTAGQVLTSGGAGAAPSWSTPVGGLGYGQTWQSVTASRALATDYTNSTGKPIMLSVCLGLNTTKAAQILVDGVEIAQAQGEYASVINRTIQCVIPPSSVYRLNSVGAPAIVYWNELR